MNSGMIHDFALLVNTSFGPCMLFAELSRTPQGENASKKRRLT